jgi:predicted ATPase
VVAVNLAPLLHPALVESAIAKALGVETPADEPLVESIIAAVGDARVLVLLDNFEHLGQGRRWWPNSLLRVRTWRCW